MLARTQRLLEDYRGFPRDVYLLCFGSWINRAGSFLVPFLTIFLTQEKGFEPQFAATAIAAFGIGSVAANLLGGHLADRFGRKPAIVGSMLGSAIMLLIIPRLESGAALLLWVFLFAIIAETYRPAVSAVLADLLPDEQRTHAFGLMYLAINLGFTTAAAAGGWLAARSFSWLFLTDAVTCAGFGLVMMMFVSESRPTKAAAALQASEAETTTAQPDRSPKNQDEAQDLSRPSAWTFPLVCLAVTLVSMTFSQGFSNLPLDLAARGIGTEGYGRLLAINGLLITLLQIPATSWVDRWHRGVAIVAGSVLTAVGFGLKGVVDAPVLLGGCIVIWTLGEIMMGPVLPAIVSDLAPIEQRGRYLGWLNMLFPLSLVIGGPLGAFVLNTYGSQALWAGALAVGLVGAALFASISSALDPKRHQRTLRQRSR